MLVVVLYEFDLVISYFVCCLEENVLSENFMLGVFEFDDFVIFGCEVDWFVVLLCDFDDGVFEFWWV